MIQIVYWGLQVQYTIHHALYSSDRVLLQRYTPTNKAAAGAAAGLVAQSRALLMKVPYTIHHTLYTIHDTHRALLMKEWRGYGGTDSYAGSGRYVYENFGADTGEGYGYSSEAQPMYRCY
jgi:hypothetical protein